MWFFNIVIKINTNISLKCCSYLVSFSSLYCAIHSFIRGWNIFFNISFSAWNCLHLKLCKLLLIITVTTLLPKSHLYNNHKQIETTLIERRQRGDLIQIFKNTFNFDKSNRFQIGDQDSRDWQQSIISAAIVCLVNTIMWMFTRKYIITNGGERSNNINELFPYINDNFFKNYCLIFFSYI